MSWQNGSGPELSLSTHLKDLHRDKVVLVTGGSGGIGAEVGRVLALCGAKVMLAARREAELSEVKARIIAELEADGYPDAASRVEYFANCDIGNLDQVKALADQTLKIFGKVDFLINNAAITGGEAMVIDLPLEIWRETLQANLTSNYALMRLFVQQMKARGEGYVINVSSFYGGEKYMAIAYPNRADYGTSKAGQRAMVEAFARFLGPEIQINAVAPGPVIGERLHGSATRPGMFTRRARVILENKRLNQVYAALISLNRTGQPLPKLLISLLTNTVESVINDASHPQVLRKLATHICEQSDPEGASRYYFLNPTLATKLVKRLERGSYLPTDWLLKSEMVAKLASNLPNTEPFFTQAEFEREGQRIAERNLGMLYLKRMPTNLDLAVAMAHHLADRFVTGETFFSSGGLRLERAVTEGELFGQATQDRLEQLRGTTVFIFGECLQSHLIHLAKAYLEDYGVRQVIFLTETDKTAAELLNTFPTFRDRGQVVAIPTYDQLEESFDNACHLYGRPVTVISTPFRPITHSRLAGPPDGDWDEVLSAEGFASLIEEQLTYHFRIAQRASLINDARIVMVTPPVDATASDEELALANFVKTTLHAFTATLGAESERTIHHSAINQVDLARRAREEEPRNAYEEQEKMARFVTAVLLTSTPLPGPRESRYRSRIYRGNAITV